MVRLRWSRISLFLQWPVIIRKRSPRGVCDDCWGQGEYMVMRPGMMVPCECSPVELTEGVMMTTATFIPTDEATTWRPIPEEMPRG